jgi:glycerol-3-phosphate dehydrogenase (NAD(P)+)
MTSPAGNAVDVSVIGCGRWASFLAWYGACLGHRTLISGRQDSPRLRQLQETRANQYLALPDGVELVSDLGQALRHAPYILVAVGAQQLRGFSRELAALDVAGKTFVLCMKGLEAQTGKRLTQVLRDEAGPSPAVATWVGPGHVQDFLSGIPSCMVVTSESPGTTIDIITRFSSELIRFYVGHDLVGNEVGAAAKNVIGIAAGMLDGLHLGALKGPLMARGAHEVAALIRAMGGDGLSAYGLAHLGDYQATLFSEHSHNRRFGEAFVRGERFAALAEGVATLDALLVLSTTHGVEMPICAALKAILYERHDPRSALRELLLRPVKSEFGASGSRD